jgi:drug/metabolite transporter (DMT)-like permease
MISKSMQYAAISLIPLTLSSCISFTTGPIFSALIAFILIKEKLTRPEMIAIALGICGTAMLTVPQWFIFLGLDTDKIE